MADKTYRADRGRDPLSWDNSRQVGGDPLAELARLIGQSEPAPDHQQHDDYQPENAQHTALPAGVDWVPQETPLQYDHRAAAYDAPTVPARHDSYDSAYEARHQSPQAQPQSYDPAYEARHQSFQPQPQSYDPAYEAQEQGRGHEESASGGHYFAGSASAFNGFRQESDAYGRHQQAEPEHDPHAYSSEAYYDTHDPAAQQRQHGDHDQEHDQAYADDYDDAPAPARRRRGGLTLVMALLGLAVAGTASAFAYRTMFGGSVLPTLPPIIRAGTGPNKIMPDAQANGAGQANVATTGSSESLVSREEQPVAIDPPKTPHVVSTIPIVTGNGQGSVPPGVADAASPPMPQNQPWPSPQAANPAPAAPPAAVPAAPAAQGTAEPKKIHTVTIRGDQPGAGDAGAAPAKASAAANPAHTASVAPRAAAAAPAAGSNAPMSIVPGQGAPAAAAAPAHPRPPRTTVASASSAGDAQATSGGYAVQVSSQRTEGEALAAYRSLRAKYPNLLSGRPMIRRADLGEKGTFYRALAGPFGTAEEAAALCSNLKAAGGSCIVQRN
jgi:hypothetical protein